MSLEVGERVAYALLLLATAWPAQRALASAAFRRVFAHLAAPLAGAAALHAGIALLAAARCPLAPLRALAGGAALWLAALVWHGTVARGRSRRWPPGNLRPLALGPWCDRDYFRAAAARHGSPFRYGHLLRPTACVVGLGAGHGLLRRHDADLSSPPMAFGRFIPGGFLRHMPRERHGEAKAILGAAFSEAVEAPLEPAIRDGFRDAFAAMAAEARAEPGRGAAPRRHVQRAVFALWARMFFGIEPGTPELLRLRELYKTIDIRNPRRASDGAVRAAVAAIGGMARSRVAAGEAVEAATFLAALARRRPGALDDPAILANLIFILHTTWADVSGLLVWLLRQLTEHPEWAERLRSSEPAEDGAPPLATRVVLETLRLEQSEYLYRVAERDLELGAHVVPRGWMLRVCVQESHRDPAVFARPDEFDPDRFLGRTYALHEYSPFGAGSRHACLGERLTLRVGTVFVEELCRGWRWTSVADGAPEQSAWRHWRPSSAWRVEVREAR